jgi:hypothetical protein
MKILATLDELDEAERMENENKDEDNSADN